MTHYPQEKIKPYNESEGKAAQVEKMFDNIAGNYDKLNHILSMDIDKSWRRKAVKEIVSGNPLTILDVACGTGDFSIAIAREAAPGSHVTGLDLSEGMMEIGREKVSASGLDGTVSMEQGDCEQMNFPDGTFDRVSAAFGVRNFEHLEKGLREMLRVLKPGGKTVILELSVPGNPVLRFLYKLYFLHVLPAVGGKVSGDKAAYRYLPASVLRFPKPKEFARIMENCGFERVQVKSFTFGICRMYSGYKR